MKTKNIEFKLKDINDPFSQGFSSYFMQKFAVFHNLDLGDWSGDSNLVRGEKIVISDHKKCDIGLMNVDTDSVPPEAKMVFCNAKSDYRNNEFYFPYLQNARNESLIIDIFEKNVNYNKKYHCVAIFNSYTNGLRKKITNELINVCDVVIVDGKNIKGGNLSSVNDHWNILRDSEFCICPPGHVNETYRFYEALKCHCIPLEFNNCCKRFENFSSKYIINENNLKEIMNIEYSKEEISRVQNNLDTEVLLKYLVGKISSYGIG